MLCVTASGTLDAHAFTLHASAQFYRTFICEMPVLDWLANCSFDLEAEATILTLTSEARWKSGIQATDRTTTCCPNTDVTDVHISGSFRFSCRILVHIFCHDFFFFFSQKLLSCLAAAELKPPLYKKHTARQTGTHAGHFFHARKSTTLIAAASLPRGTDACSGLYDDAVRIRDEATFAFLVFGGVNRLTTTFGALKAAKLRLPEDAATFIKIADG